VCEPARRERPRIANLSVVIPDGEPRAKARGEPIRDPSRSVLQADVGPGSRAKHALGRDDSGV